MENRVVSPLTGNANNPNGPGNPRDYSPPRRNSPPPGQPPRRRYSRSPPPRLLSNQYGGTYGDYPPPPPPPPPHQPIHRGAPGPSYYQPPPPYPPSRDIYRGPRGDSYGGYERDRYPSGRYGPPTGRRDDYYAGGYARRGPDGVYPPSQPYGYSRPPRKEHRLPNPNPSRVLGVFGLNLQTTEKDLEGLFGEYGTIEKVNLVYDRKTRGSRGFGFVYFERQEDADKALSQTNGLNFMNRMIRVDYSATDKPHEPMASSGSSGSIGGGGGRNPPSNPRYYENGDRRRSRSPPLSGGPRYSPNNRPSRSRSPSPVRSPRTNW
jgi:transformer-2 protein